MTDMPKQELLRKLLNLTTSPVDGEVLSAIRKANALLTAQGWTWDQLIAGKIKIIESPFTNIPKPPTNPDYAAARGHVPPQPQTKPQPQPKPDPWFTTLDPVKVYPTQPPPPPPRPQRRVPLSNKGNVYAGSCYCCGNQVDQGKGFVFKPHDFNPGARDIWAVICTPCNAAAAPVANMKAKKASSSRGKAYVPSTGEL